MPVGRTGRNQRKASQLAESILSAGGGVVPPAYSPLMMTFDGATGYYNATGFSTSGNLVKLVVRFNRASFSGAGAEYVSNLFGVANYERAQVLVFSNDFGTATSRGKVRVRVKNTAGAQICDLLSTSVVTDNSDYLLYFSYDGDAGTAVLRIDGVDEDDGTYPSRVLTTGTVASGIHSQVGAFDDANHFGGKIGYFGYDDDYSATDYAFFGTGANPIEQNTTTWLQGWGGSQPLTWNDEGDLDVTNDGSDTLYVKNGTITGPA